MDSSRLTGREEVIQNMGLDFICRSLLFVCLSQFWNQSLEIRER